MKLVMNLLRYIGIIIYYLPLEHISNNKKLPEEPEWGQRATTRGPGALVARPRGWPRQGGARTPGGPPGCPRLLQILRLGKPSKEEPFFTISPLFRRRRASEVGSTSRLLPGTL